MQLRLTRTNLQPKFTVGRLEVLQDGQWVYLCDTMEEAVRERDANGKFPVHKTWGYVLHTAVPAGTYTVTIDVPSPRYCDYKQYPFAASFKGCIPRLVNVEQFYAALIKPGVRRSNLNGSIIVGRINGYDRMCDSLETWTSLYRNYLRPARRLGEKITIEII